MLSWHSCVVKARGEEKSACVGFYLVFIVGCIQGEAAAKAVLPVVE